MKSTSKENKIFSDAIDSINDGLEDVIELYNELEDDRPLIAFEDEVVQTIEKAKRKYGDDFVDQKINTVVKEMISWLPLDEEPTEIGEETANNEEE